MDYFLFDFSGVQFHYTMSHLLFSPFIQPVCFSSKTIIYLDETSKYNNNRPLKLTFQRAVQI